MVRIARRGFMALAGSALALSARAQTQDTVSPEAREAVTRMGKTLSSGAFSFDARTIREYHKDNLPLHIVHNASVTVRRPDRLRIDISGDDGDAEIGYDGKTLIILNEHAKKYGTMPITGDIETMLRTASDKMGLDFPLADLLANQPGQAFLDGVISGIKVGGATMDGAAWDHFFFVQPPGIELELWTEANDQALPRRLIITYRSIPGEPQFLAALAGWKLNIDPPDDAFQITLPSDATKVEEKAQ